ncbi:MAG: hypothetical protein Q8S03_14335 [Brevundimonas sp.]|uniref:hypothetical protein n=1 Tax=Brevundimonas sp. TaxID=1871086 RepID=UPI0027349DEA|nr:hypothetical protein [Brevundimonas sp.]MBX9614501.1 hypothetical protein [Caulobacteraceae bacterium]MDP3405869.1 hypothetical protein [Brevundimonas sp.]
MMQRLLAAAALSAALLAPAAHAQTEAINFTLTNNTEQVLTHLYISLPSTDEWEEDIFGSDVLGSGETFEISIDDGLDECVYDVRADFDDGDSIQVASVDFCELDGSDLVIE